VDDSNTPSERIFVEYAADAKLGPATRREIPFPTFAESGHMITFSEPERLRQVVATFLEETGL
jgi:hypothetical protein